MDVELLLAALLGFGPPVREPRSLADAVLAARPGDTIVVASGVYRERTIVINKPLTIVGAPGAILDGANATHILRIESDDVTVRGLTFRNVTPSHVEDRAAIRAGEVARCVIEDNRIERAVFGIYLAGSRDCRIARNTLATVASTEEATGNGIHLWTARNVAIFGNRIRGHRDGIYLEFAHGTVVADNVSERNLRYGLHFMSSDDCGYQRNVFRANQAGVAVMYARRVAMIDNDFQDNWGPAAYGLLLKEIYDSRLQGNRFARNTTALLADGAVRMHATGNRFSDNGWAVKLMASTHGATLVNNTFRGNSFDVATNSATSDTRLAGNYWDDYRGYDANGDGMGDVPHRPVRLFSLIVERHEPTMVLLRSPLVAVLDGAERVLPSLTPERLTDPRPLMRAPR